MFDLPVILIAGADGQLGYEAAALAQDEGFTVVALGHQALDLCSAEQVAAALALHRPSYVINAAVSYEGDLGVNDLGAGLLAQACAEANVVLVHLSCAEVFDGLEDAPYNEEYQPIPVSDYGRSKVLGEEAVRRHLARHIILRSGWLFSARGDNVVRRLLDRARQNQSLEVTDQLTGSPTAAADLARVILAIIKQLDCGCEGWGTYHYGGSEPISWFGFCEAVIAAARQYEDLPLAALTPVPHTPAGWRVMPLNSRLDCSRIRSAFGIHQRTWRSGLMQAVRTLNS